MRAALALMFGLSLAAQDFSQRGFLELRTAVFPQTAPNDRGRVVASALLRYEATYRIRSGWRVSGGLDARTDTHHQTERQWTLSWQDRERQRPAFAVRRAGVVWERPGVTLELGKQFIRWGKADILNPTDRFAPRDFLAVVDNEFLAVTAARLSVGAHGDTLEMVWAPRLTPSRVPLLNQRWAPLPQWLQVREEAPHWPGGGQFGARWNHVGSGWEASLSFYEGYNHLPSFEVRPVSAEFPVRIEARRFHPRLRMGGADAAVPLGPVTLKGEAAWFGSPAGQADEYVLYVVQAERQAGEWVFVGGYAGEAVTRRRPVPGFAPDRGLTQAFLGRASYTIDANRSVAAEGAVRRTGDGLWLKLEYSQALGQHWRATAGFTLIRGAPTDFLGQYRRNSHSTLTLRYSF